ncbi:thioester dehydrase [Shewanella sp. AS16]|uniref:ApeI family dehydratase n=1 Tax=Shewanella sp. AS16 TaxID=2907625 RepID=UPI001F2A254C|nr:thioester dehydrase [Shewanella sp. AS16]MCE9687938.1 thioester dehydrase [Shewanella sp. AS16]
MTNHAPQGQRSQLPPVLSQEATATTLELQLFIDASLGYFEGHFPEQAVLPGVTQLDWAIRFGCRHFGYPLDVATLEVLKFQQLLLPDTQVKLTLSHDQAKRKLTFGYSQGEQRYASGRIALGSTEA